MTDKSKQLLKEIKSIAEEIQSVKKLLILFLIKSGATSEEIGQTLSIDSSAVRRMFPIKKIKKFKGA